jgi:hypothetical protein
MATIGSSLIVAGQLTNIPAVIAKEFFSNELAYESTMNLGIYFFNTVFKTKI